MSNSEEKLRQRAIELYENNVPIQEILTTLKKSKSWFYKWLKRYRQRGHDWFKEDSRAPKTKSRKTSLEMENLVLTTRKQLENQAFHQYGPQAIFYELSAQGINPPPVWAIARILRRNGMVKKQFKKTYQSKGRAYPYAGFSLCHQMDYIGPRYLEGGQSYFCHTVIFEDAHLAQVIIQDNFLAQSTCGNLINFWKVAGIPDFLQMDNSISFWGSLRMPNALGKVIRLCLSLGVTPVFIPVKEPWRNGIVEHFNKTFQSAVLTKKYKNIEELKKSASTFCDIHNQTHHYSSQNGMTPMEAMKKYGHPWHILPEDYQMPQGEIEIEEGQIYIIRFIRSDLKFNLFGLSFPVPEELMYHYVMGVILTAEHKLKIFKEQNFITEFPFKIL